jgi:aspartate 1-decarboxylase
LDYEGSLPISSDLAERVEFLEYEKILVGNINNSARFEMYALHAKDGGESSN